MWERERSMDISMVVSQVLTAIIHDKSREKPLLLPLSMQLYQLREQFPLSLYGQRGNRSVKKRRKNFPFPCQEKENAFWWQGSVSKASCRNFKETGSRDGLELSWHAWVNLGPNKVCGRILNFSGAAPSEKVFLYSLRLMQTPLLLTLLSPCIWSKLSCLLIGQSSGPSLAIGWTKLKVLRRQIWSFTNLTLLN